MSITPVVLCGGSGTRLWPLSREAFPKQFVPLLQDGGKPRSLLQATIERVAPLGDVVAIGNDEHRFLVQEAFAAAGCPGRQYLEPEGRNTAAAMAWAALDAPAGQLLLFLPADHFIPHAAAFRDMVESGVRAAQEGYIVTFGVAPSSPSTAYGYIRVGAPLENGLERAEGFIEKPDADRAAQMLAVGGHYWNAGIFLARTDALLDALQQHAPDILGACRAAVAAQVEDGSFVRPGRDQFLACRSDSIDYAVLEKHDRIAVARFAGAWSDVGSWNAVAALSEADEQGNRISGQGHVFEAANTYLNAPHRPVVALGTRNMIIVDTPDAVLVAAGSHAEQVKDVVASLKALDLPEVVTHRRVVRPWGWYDSIEAGEGFQVKRIVVKPRACLSLQRHRHRAEHWVVVRGVARVTNGDHQFDLRSNESTYIPVGAVHRLENQTEEPLEIIEVQSGAYLGEDDIVRIEDQYGRAVE